MIKPFSWQIQEHIQNPFWQPNLNQENCSKTLPSPPLKICSPPSTEDCSYEYKRPSAKIQAKSFKSRFPLPQWDTYFSSLGGPWRKVLQRWSEDFQTTGSRGKKSIEHTQGEEGETIPYRTCEVADRNRGGGNGSDTQPVSEIEIRDGGSCRWGSFDHWKLGLVQKDPHCFSLLKNTVTKYTFSLFQILLFGVDLQKRRETLILSSSWLSTQSALPSAARLLIPHRIWRQPPRRWQFRFFIPFPTYIFGLEWVIDLEKMTIPSWTRTSRVRNAQNGSE